MVNGTEKSKLKLSLWSILPRGMERVEMADARKYVAREALTPHGVVCPCCGQKAKVYRRPFRAGFAQILGWLVDAFDRDARAYHLNTEAPRPYVRSRDYSFLEKWGLASQKARGWWVPTRNGGRFVNEGMTVDSHVLVYNNRTVGYEGEKVTFTDDLPEATDGIYE